jgi:hypothetical protein
LLAALRDQLQIINTPTYGNAATYDNDPRNVQTGVKPIGSVIRHRSSVVCQHDTIVVRRPFQQFLIASTKKADVLRTRKF